jgi:formylglycine-generating enzyme required for sulfatase activity/aminoglycoside phosphotransferase (APT) family kinase protein
MFGARKFLLDVLMHERSLDRDAIQECDKLRIDNRQTFSEVLVSEGVVTDQELGRLLEKFADEGHISPAELTLLKNEFPSNWERWKEMEERDEEVAARLGEPEAPGPQEPHTAPEQVLIGESPADAGEPEKIEGGQPLTERVNRGTLQEALEDLMHDAPVKEYPSSRKKPVAEDMIADPMLGMTIGGAKIISKVGQGEFGTVYKGVIEDLGKSVAVRVIRNDALRESHRLQALRSAKDAIKVEHRNVAQVISVDEGDYYIYMVSKFVEGHTLRARLESGMKFSQEEALEIALQVARALRAGHDKDVYHGDIKPENIFIDSEGQALVTDFGLAKSAEIDKSGGSKQSLFMGSPQYMAPEQFDAEPPDARTDIYALGIVLYEMLTGVLPFGGSTAFAIRDAHLAGSPKLVTEIDGNLSPTVAKLIAKMTAKEPDKRYQGMTQLINDMIDLKQHLVSGGAVPAIAPVGTADGPEPTAEVRERAKRYKTVAITPKVKKGRGFKIVIVLLILIVAAGAGVYTYISKPNLFKIEDDFEGEATSAFKETKRKAQLMLAQRKYIAALRELDAFPAKFFASKARRELDEYRNRVFEEADKRFAKMEKRVNELCEAERIEAARLQNRALRSAARQIVAGYGEKWPKAALLKKYLVQTEIGEALEKVKDFEVDMKLAEDLLKEDKFVQALEVVNKYIEIPIAKYQARAKKLAKDVSNREKFLKSLALNKDELERFEKAVKAAEKDIKPVVALLEHMKPAGRRHKHMIRAKKLVKDFEKDMKRAEDFLEQDKLGEALKVIKEHVINPVVRHKGEARKLAQRIAEKEIERAEKLLNNFGQLLEHMKRAEKLSKNFEKLLKDFEEDMKCAEDFLEQDKPGEALKVIKEHVINPVVRHKGEARKLAQRIAERGKELKEEAKEAAREEIERAEKLLKNIEESIRRSDEVLKNSEELLNSDMVIEDFDRARARIQEFANSKQQRIALEVIRILARIDEKKEEYTAAKAREKHYKQFNSDIEYGHKLLKEEKYEEALSIVATYRNDLRLTAKQEKRLLKLEKDAQDRIKFRKDFEKIDKLLAEKKFLEARRTCVRWRYYPDKAVQDAANKKYLEIMDAREPGMVYIVGGTAILGSHDYAVQTLIEALKDKDKDEEIRSKAVKELSKITEQDFGEDHDKWKAWNKKNKDDKNPKRKVRYRTFYIDRHEVTCGEYENFVKDKKHAPPTNWPQGRMPRQWASLPVTGVTRKDAAAYAKWDGKRLPTDAEWEIAASWDGKKKVLYPWGNTYVEGSANIATGATKNVGSQSKDKSPNGIFDMAGNVAEWTGTKSAGTCIVRGSSAEKGAGADNARTTRRLFLKPNTTSDFLGFRCAKDTD